MRINRRSAAVTVIAALMLSQASVLSASAADVTSDIAFDTPNAQTIEYGQGYYFSLSSDASFVNSIYQNGGAVVTMTGAPAGYVPELSMYTTSGPPEAGKGSIYSPFERAPLNAGSYVITVSGSYTDGTDTWAGQTAPGANLTIEKAKLGMDLRVLADPSDGDAAIVSARFTGRFVDEYQSSFFPGAALSPAGAWHITLTDENGETALDRTIERSAGDDILATSVYWTDAEPGMQYTATGEFIASGGSASNFTITSAPEFRFTAPELQRPVPTSTATAKPNTALPDAAPFSLPLWALGVVGLLLAGLTALVVILSVRLRRRPRVETSEVRA